MTKVGGIIVVVLSLLAGFGGGWTYQATVGGKSAATSTATSASTTKQSKADCLKEVWGDDKYAAIGANPSLATTEDNLAALKCYE